MFVRPWGMWAGRAPAFTPADLPALVHWWHAVDSPKTGSPGAISQMDDLIGSLDVAQATGANQPTDNTRTINGKVALDFDGTNDALTVATGPSVSANGTVYMFVVLKIDALADNAIILDTGGIVNTNDGFLLRLDENDGTPGGELQLVWANGTTQEKYNPATPVVGTTDTYLIEAWIIGTTGGVNIAVNGVNAAGGANTVGFGSPDTMSIFARISLTPLDGAFCEAGFCTAVPDAGNRASLLAYAQSYWGVP